MHLMYGVCHELQLLQKHRAGCSLSLKIPLYKKKKKTERKRKGEIFIKLASHQQEACLSNILHVFVLGGLVEVLQTVAACCICSFYCWPVSKTITGRLLHAFMKYSNGCMSYCALIMPHKDRKEGRGQTQMGRQEEIMKEHCIYWNVEK